MAEVFLGPLLEVLFDRLLSSQVQEFVSQFAGISASELKKWETRLRMMEAVLIDAEEKQISDRAVKIWLDDLKDLAYDVEDILDEFATEAVRRELKLKSRSKVRSLVTAPFSKLKFNRDMAARIEGITSQLDELCKVKSELGLVSSVGPSCSSATPITQRMPSTCLPPEYDVGREEEKERILESLLSDDSSECDSNYQVVSIVGLGGIGKTTLTQAVYNHNKVVKNFNLRIWVCVSQDYDVMKISKAILESVTSAFRDLNELNKVQVELQKLLAGKKFLVVLDDVWSKSYDKWVALRSPFAAGALGSKIIVTTRDMGVAATMGSIAPCVLNRLSDDDCRSVFKKHAFVNADAGARDDEEAVSEKVVKRCRGLPLAARTLGGLLRSKQKHEWEEILDSKLWESSFDGSNILPVLRLSYQYLPAHLKRCFAYCAIFPQDYDFEEEEVILLWMAEGLLSKSPSRKQMEDLGRELFQDLLSRSIFQRSGRSNTKYAMHDLVNDLAQSVSGETSFRLEDAIKESKFIKRARHSSYISEKHEGKNKFEIFHKSQHLRTFLPISSLDWNYICDDFFSNPYTENGNYISNKVIFDLLPKSKKLRVLSLEGYTVDELPDSIKDLIHLRYLNLATTSIRSLPESTSSLLNLQTLILKNCSKLEKLPYKLQDLSHLRYLDLRGATSISEMPAGMEELKSLRNLTNFIVSKQRGSSLNDLKNLKFLRGELCISGLENAYDAWEAILNDMIDLKVLILKWAIHSDDHSRDKKEERKLLDILRPHTQGRSSVWAGPGRGPAELRRKK